MHADEDYRVYMVKFPTGDIKGAVRLDSDGFPSIYINDSLCPRERRAALQHELRHIARGDHSSTSSIDEIEK